LQAIENGEAIQKYIYVFMRIIENMDSSLRWNDGM
jgi:hypothetical protein